MIGFRSRRSVDLAGQMVVLDAWLFRPSDVVEALGMEKS